MGKLCAVATGQDSVTGGKNCFFLHTEGKVLAQFSFSSHSLAISPDGKCCSFSVSVSLLFICFLQMNHGKQASGVAITDKPGFKIENYYLLHNMVLVAKLPQCERSSNTGALGGVLPLCT